MQRGSRRAHGELHREYLPLDRERAEERLSRNIYIQLMILTHDEFDDPDSRTHIAGYIPPV